MTSNTQTNNKRLGYIALCIAVCISALSLRLTSLTKISDVVSDSKLVQLEATASANQRIRIR